MKFSVSLSAILAILPALALAASPLDGRSNGDMYFPRHHARAFGRQRQGAFGQHGAHAPPKQGQGQQAAANGKNKSKSSTSIAAATTAKAATSTAAAVAAVGKNKNKHGGGNHSSTTAAADASSTDTATSTDTASQATSGTSSAAATSTSDVTGSVADDGNPDTSLDLLPSLVATGLEQNGQETPTAGQVASLTSKNNFINYCAGKTITNGQQITTGSCDPIPMGDIIPKANMPSGKFKFPTNFGTVPANQNFTVQMVLQNLQAGTFTNAQKTYYMAPQQLNNQNVLIGHTHFVIQSMGSFDSPSILNPANFTFFKGIDGGQDANGIVSATVAGGVPAGNYRLASINTDANHAPAVVAVAQHGCLEDMVYFTAQ